MREIETCVFDDCDEPAVDALTARWQDGYVWTRNVCLVHTPRGVDSLQHFREPEDGEPIVTQVALV
jgi:hypothetical protein